MEKTEGNRRNDGILGWDWESKKKYPEETKDSVINREIENYGNRVKLLGTKIQLTIRNIHTTAVIVRGDWETEELELPSFVEEIGPGAFELNSRLKRIRGSSVRVIGEEAFKDCRALEEVDFPNLEIIEHGAFRNTHIESVDFKNVYDIGECAFYGCNNIKSVKIPDAVGVGYMAFAECRNLKEVDLSSLIVVREYTFKNCMSLEKLNIPNARKIHNYATINCGKINK